MKVTRIEFIPHRLKRKVRWQTASYSADSLQLFYVTLTSSVPRRPSSCRPRLPNSRSSTAIWSRDWKLSKTRFDCQPDRDSEST